MGSFRRGMVSSLHNKKTHNTIGYKNTILNLYIRCIPKMSQHIIQTNHNRQVNMVFIINNYQKTIITVISPRLNKKYSEFIFV